MSLLLVALVSVGVACLILGGLVLWHGRRPFGQFADAEEEGRPTVPTRMGIGVLLLFVGYHLVIWAFPRSLTVLQWPRERWFWLIPLALAALGLSAWTDRLERGRQSIRDGAGRSAADPERKKFDAGSAR